MVILQSILRWWVVDIDFTTIFVIFNIERYILCYWIFNYDDNCIFDMYVSYMSFIIICITNFESVFCCNLFHIFEAVKELHKVPFKIMIYTSIGKFMISNTSNQQTPNTKHRRNIRGHMIWLLQKMWKKLQQIIDSKFEIQMIINDI